MKGPLGGIPWRVPEAPRPFPPAPSWCHVCGIHYAPHPSKPCPTCKEPEMHDRQPDGCSLCGLDHPAEAP